MTSPHHRAVDAYRNLIACLTLTERRDDRDLADYLHSLDAEESRMALMVASTTIIGLLCDHHEGDHDRIRAWLVEFGANVAAEGEGLG